MLRGGALLVAALLLLPTALAAGASGSFLAAGHTRLPAGAQLRVEPLALLGADAGGLDDLVLTAARLRVHVFETHYVVVRTPTDTVGTYLANGSDTYVLTDATLRLSAPPSDGFLAAYPREGAHVVLTGSSAAEVAARAHSDLATATGPTPLDPDPFASRQHARQEVSVPHALTGVAGAIDYEGPLLLKVKGLHLTGRSAEGAAALDTRRDDASDAAGHTVVRWAILEAEGAHLEARSRTPWQVAWSEAQASWHGEMTFFPLAGELRTDDVSYVANAGAATLDGRFSGTISVLEDGAGALLTRLALDGDVSRTTLSVQGASALLSVPRLLPSGLLMALAVAFCMGGAGFTAGAFYARRRARGVFQPTFAPIPVPPAIAMPFTAEDCCDAGAKAASEEDWAGAAKWFGRARTLAPTSARICADLAFSLSQIGDVDEALRHYAEASRLCADGEADFNGALAALHGARPLGEIEEWLERALARSPGLVMPLEADDDFKVLHGRTRYERAVDHAWQCLARRGEGPGPA